MERDPARPAGRSLRAALLALSLPVVLGAGLLSPQPAEAQAFRGPVTPRGAEQPQRQAPAALPGLQGRRAPAPIPPDPEAGSLSPNDALFDAINRGDLPAAREAVGRGASTDARNVLGLTAIDSAVDQGRTEILFYLLSVRGTARGGSGPPPEAAPQPRLTPQQRRAAAAAAAASAREAERAAVPARAAPPAARLPRLWAGDGGAPIPSIGFLGFDAGRPSGGPPAPREARGQARAGGGRG